MIFTDDFSSGNLNKWDGSSNVTVVSQAANFNGGGAYLLKTKVLDNCSTTLDLKFVASGNQTFRLRIDDGTNNCDFWCRQDTSSIQLLKNGDVSGASGSYTFTPNNFYTLKLVKSGSNFNAYINSVLQLTANNFISFTASRVVPIADVWVNTQIVDNVTIDSIQGSGSGNMLNFF